jgi:hypothetical protein
MSCNDHHTCLTQSKTVACCIVPAFFIIVCASFFPIRAGAGTTTDLVNVAVVLPGTTRTIKVVQLGTFPFGCPHLYILVMGSGTLGISLRNDSAAAETIFMLGLARSGGTATPIARIGSSPGLISQMIDIDDAHTPGALVWLYCGVAYAGKDPTYLYDLRLSLAP